MASRIHQSALGSGSVNERYGPEGQRAMKALQEAIEQGEVNDRTITPQTPDEEGGERANDEDGWPEV